MAAALKRFDNKPIPELDSAQYVATMTKEDGTTLGSAELTTLTLTIYALNLTRSIVNSVNAVSILNTGRGVVSAGGVLTLTLNSLDNQVVDQTLPEEKHLLYIVGTWSAGTRRTSRLAEITIVNMPKAP